MTRTPSIATDTVCDHAALIEYPDVRSTPARVGVRQRGGRERTLRAARTLAMCWALAVAAVFLPVIHFLLVPGLLLLGPVLAWAHLHEARTLVSATGACPACALPLLAPLGQPWRERTLLRCDGCHRQVVLVLASAPGEPPGPRREPPDGVRASKLA